VKYAIIGGTGVYDPELLSGVRTETVTTPYGTVQVQRGCYEGLDIGFLARHGQDHSIPPHRINYRANIFALKKLGTERILSTNAVGSVNRSMQPGDFVVVDQYLDFTKTRDHTFFDGGENPVVHTDVSDPYCPELREALFDSGRSLGLRIHPRGCYACFEGPRFETAAEIRMTGLLGGDLAGMTGVPEATLAREAGICYSTTAMVTNMGAGIAAEPLSHDEVVEIMGKNTENLKGLLMKALVAVPSHCRCTCSHNKTPLRGL